MNQSVTMISPSGFRLGTSTKITLSRIFFTSGASLVARRCTSSTDICVAPISVAWMLQVISSTSLPWRKISSRSLSDGAPPWKYSFFSSCL